MQRAYPVARAGLAIAAPVAAKPRALRPPGLALRWPVSPHRARRQPRPNRRLVPTRSLARVGEFEGRCGCLIATATNLFGPYGPRYEVLPYAGHNMFFRDERGRWWSTFFGSDGRAPWRERPGIFPIEFDADGRVRAAQP